MPIYKVYKDCPAVMAWLHRVRPIVNDSSARQAAQQQGIAECLWVTAVSGCIAKHKLSLTLNVCIAGRAVAVVCVNPSAASQTSSTSALTAAERMMPV